MPTRNSLNASTVSSGSQVSNLFFDVFAGENLHPGDLSRAFVRLGHCLTSTPLARRPDIRAGAIPANERNDRLIRNAQLPIADRDFAAGLEQCRSSRP
jgi:hypothetical protein